MRRNCLERGGDEDLKRRWIDLTDHHDRAEVGNEAGDKIASSYRGALLVLSQFLGSALHPTNRTPETPKHQTQLAYPFIHHHVLHCDLPGLHHLIGLFPPLHPLLALSSICHHQTSTAPHLRPHPKLPRRAREQAIADAGAGWVCTAGLVHPGTVQGDVEGCWCGDCERRMRGRGGRGGRG